MKKLLIAAAILSTLAAGAAQAEENRSCTDAAKDKWMTQDAVKAKAKSMGMDIRRIKLEGSCFEVYAIDSKGAKIEGLFNPATGEMVGNENGESGQ